MLLERHTQGAYFWTLPVAYMTYITFLALYLVALTTFKALREVHIEIKAKLT